MKKSRLGDVLLKQERVSREQMDNAIREAKLHGGTLISQLVRLKLFSEDELVMFIVRSSGCPPIDLDKAEILEDMARIPLDILRKNIMLPVQRRGMC